MISSAAVRLGLKFSILRQAPTEAPISAGNSCERKALRKFVKPGESIVADRAVGITWQGRVRLGAKWRGEPVRLVRNTIGGKQILIAALMSQSLTGKRPRKRAMELIQLYQLGYLKLEAGVVLLGLEKPRI